MYSKLEEICLSFYDDVYYYILSLSKDRDLAKDVTQDTFLKALKSLHKLQDESKVKSWLFSIARNSFFTEAKKAKKTVYEELLEELTDSRALSPEQFYLLREQDEWWAKLLAGLSGEDRRILEARVHDKLSYEEIAAQIGLNPGAVRVKFHRLRIKLIKLLGSGER